MFCILNQIILEKNYLNLFDIPVILWILLRNNQAVFWSLPLLKVIINSATSDRLAQASSSTHAVLKVLFAIYW